MNIACTIDGNYIRHCAVMLKSLHDSNPGEDINIYIIHNELDPQQRALLAGYLGTFLDSVSFIQLNQGMLDGFPVHGHITIATYFRLLLPAILPWAVDKVIFLDCDMIVVDSIRELWNSPLEEHPLGAIIDRSQAENCKRIGLADGSKYFNGGVLLIDLKQWREQEILKKGLQFAVNNVEKIEFWDQDVLNHLFEGQWLQIDARFNALPHLWGMYMQAGKPGYSLTAAEERTRDQPAVIHFAGAGTSKPWHFRCQHPWADHYRALQKETPWADVPFDGQPPPPPPPWVRLWERSRSKAIRVAKKLARER